MTEYSDDTFGTDILERLIEEYESEVRAENTWPILVLQSETRTHIWSICESVGQSDRGVPATACRLIERYLSCTSRTYLKEHRDPEAWARHKRKMGSQMYIIIVACIQLAAKMCDRVSHVPASLMRTVLTNTGIHHTKAEILAMEINVYKTLDFRLPMWTTLEMAEFLASMVGLGKNLKVKHTLAPIMDLTEYHRDLFEYHIKAWDEACNTPGSSSSKPAGSTIYNLHMCAAVVSATVRHIPFGDPDPTERLAAIIRADVSYIKAISDIILKRILPEKKNRPLLKRKRVR